MEQSLKIINQRNANSVYVAIAGEVVNQRSVLLRNFVLNGQESVGDNSRFNNNRKKERQ
jgi:hypothetical protein